MFGYTRLIREDNFGYTKRAKSDWAEGISVEEHNAQCFAPAAVMLVVSLAMTAVSTMAQMSAQKKAGAAQERAAQGRAKALEYKAEQARQQAGQERASSQRRFANEKKRGRIIESRGVAVAAASGGGTADTSMENVIGGIGSESEFRALAALFEGEESALNLEHQASLGIFEANEERVAGAAAKRVANAQATATLFKGLGSMASTAYSGYSAPTTSMSGVGNSAQNFTGSQPMFG